MRNNVVQRIKNWKVGAKARSIEGKIIETGEKRSEIYPVL
jgi:hypothetical protein